MTTIGVLGDVSDFEVQRLIWDYVVQGDVCEFGAAVSEARDYPVTHHTAWDRTAQQLEGEFVSHGDEPYRRVKDWAALPWVSEHVLRGHVEWPGL